MTKTELEARLCSDWLGGGDPPCNDGQLQLGCPSAEAEASSLTERWTTNHREIGSSWRIFIFHAEQKGKERRKRKGGGVLSFVTHVVLKRPQN